jgi:ribosomal protein S24E
MEVSKLGREYIKEEIAENVAAGSGTVVVKRFTTSYGYPNIRQECFLNLSSEKLGSPRSCAQS